jgi:ABC-2 type transport system ATP-binding protein
MPCGVLNGRLRWPIVGLGWSAATHGEVIAVAYLDVQVEEAEIFGILGPNGPGKTTTV